MMKYCEKCGNMMADDSLFCPKCGKKVAYAETTNKNEHIDENEVDYSEEVQKNVGTQCQILSSDSVPVKKKSGGLKGCALIFVVFIIFCVIVGSCVANQSNSSKGSTSLNRTNASQVSYETESEYKASCNSSYDYNSIERRPSDYTGKRAVFQCVVNQVIENGSTLDLMVGVPKDWNNWTVLSGRYDNVFHVTYKKKSSNEDRILEDDVIRMYGELNNTITYETVLHAQRTVPDFKAEYIEIVN